MTFRTDVFLHNLFGYDLANAALVTLWISITSMALGSAIGLALALMQQSRFRPLRYVAWTYLWLFRPAKFRHYPVRPGVCRPGPRPA